MRAESNSILPVILLNPSRSLPSPGEAALTDSFLPFRVIRRDLEIAESAPLIGKVHDGEPLGRPKCKAPTSGIELVENLAVIGRILEQLGVGVPLACPVQRYAARLRFTRWWAGRERED